jgi:hypothetical protein
MNSDSTRSLRPSGMGRYITAIFLSVWLVGWIVGEVFAIAMLGAIFGSFAGAFREQLPAWSAELVTSGGAAFVLLFLLFWLTFWTIGGVAALTHLMRSLVGEDVIGLTDSGFEVVRRAGPFRRRYAFDRPAIRRLRTRRHDMAVVADTAKGTRVITTFGLPAERDEVCDWLSRHLGLSAAAAEAGTLPAAWEVRTEGEVAYVRKVRPRARFTRSLISWLLTAGIASAWYVSLDETSGRNIPALVLTLLLAAGAAMSTWGRRELLIRHGELMFRSRFAMWTTERAFRGARLELTHWTDSDNDSHYKLIVTDAAGRQTVHSQVYDSGEVADLARWLAGRTGFPLTTAEKLQTLRGRRTPSA